jgi:hypothetical protein
LVLAEMLRSKFRIVFSGPKRSFDFTSTQPAHWRWYDPALGTAQYDTVSTFTRITLRPLKTEKPPLFATLIVGRKAGSPSVGAA